MTFRFLKTNLYVFVSPSVLQAFIVGGGRERETVVKKKSNVCVFSCQDLHPTVVRPARPGHVILYVSGRGLVLLMFCVDIAASSEMSLPCSLVG